MHNEGLDHDVDQTFTHDAFVISMPSSPNQNGFRNIRNTLTGYAMKKSMSIRQFCFKSVWLWDPHPVTVGHAGTVLSILPRCSERIHQVSNRFIECLRSPLHGGSIHLRGSINILIAGPQGFSSIVRYFKISIDTMYIKAKSYSVFHA